jgi:uncharacterized peroxidase-related enzyme
MVTAAEADQLVHDLARDWRDAKLSAADSAMCAFATKLTHEPDSMQSLDIDTLRSVGFDDRAIHDATQIVGYFNYVTRVADALGIEPENFIPPWGGEAHSHRP